MAPQSRRAPDTDWHVSRLYSFAKEMGASVLVPSHSRYVVDLNRPPDDVSLYPGQNTTGLCPAVRFQRRPGLPGRPANLRRRKSPQRVERYWRPYHERLADELARLRRRARPRAACGKATPSAPRCLSCSKAGCRDLNLGDCFRAQKPELTKPPLQARLERA
jgi:hypothetical protein